MGPAQQWRKSGAMNECVRSFKLWRIIEEGKKRDAGKEKSSETAGARGEGGKGRRKGEEGRRRKTRKEDVMQGKRNRVKHLAEDEERGGCDGRKTESGETSGGDTVRSQPHSSPPDAYWNGNAL